MDATTLEKFFNSVKLIRAKPHMARGYRSTLTGVNTAELMPYIKRLIDDPSSVKEIWLKDHPTCKLKTLYLKWMGALQFIIESQTSTTEMREAAAMIKTTFIARMNKERGCLEIKLRSGRDSTPIKYQKTANKIVADNRARNPVIEWRSNFLAWVASGECGVPYIRKGLLLTESDTEFVRTMCEQNGWEHEITLNSIKVLKP